MEHIFCNGIGPLIHWYINPNEKNDKYQSSLLNQLIKALKGAPPPRKHSVKAPDAIFTLMF